MTMLFQEQVAGIADSILQKNQEHLHVLSNYGKEEFVKSVSDALSEYLEIVPSLFVVDMNGPTLIEFEGEPTYSSITFKSTDSLLRLDTPVPKLRIKSNNGADFVFTNVSFTLMPNTPDLNEGQNNYSASFETLHKIVEEVG